MKLSTRYCRYFIVLLVTVLTVACQATNPHSSLISADYSGDIVSIDDSYRFVGSGIAYMYFVKSVDGVEVYNAPKASLRASRGQGFGLTLYGESREVEAKPMTVQIETSVQYAAPIVAMLAEDSDYFVDGEVSFTPIPGQHYLVNGEADGKNSRVWIEDQNRNIVSDIIGGRKLSTSYGYTRPSLQYQIEDKRLEKFLFLNSGESKAMVIAKLGEPDEIKQRGRRITFDYHDLGRVQFITQYGDEAYVEDRFGKVQENADSKIVELQLNTSSMRVKRVMAKEFFRLSEVNESILDLFAKQIRAKHQIENRHEVDVLSWFCKILAKSKNPKYRQLLSDVSTQAKTSKLRKHAEVSLSSIPITNVAQF